MKCACCRIVIDEGHDALELIEGIVGKHGFVALSEPYIFCSIECLKEYLSPGKSSMWFPKRIP